MKPVRITYFVHGTTTDNEKGLASGWNDVGLSELGKKQSMKLKSQIKMKPDAVFCSDLKRAVDSAKLIFGFGIIRDKRLREINYGSLTGADSRKVDPLMSSHISKPFPDGESYRDVEARLRSFLDDLSRKYPGKHVAIVSHRAPQLALEVLLKGKTWQQAMKEDWRLRKEWKPGWEYLLE